MDHENSPHTMDREIFAKNLSVEAVSLYILCCSLLDQEVSVSTKSASASWTGTDETMEKAFLELTEAGIIRKILSDQMGNNAYRVLDRGHWK